MKFNFAMSYVCAFFTITLFIIYFSKKRENSARSKLYILFLVLSEIFVILDILTGVVHQYTTNFILQKFMWMSHWIVCVIIFYNYYLYVTAVINKIKSNNIISIIKYNKKTIIIGILCLLEILTYIFILPYDPFDINDINFLPGLNAIVNGGITLLIECLVCIEIITSKDKLSFDEKNAFLFQVIVYAIFVTLQFVFKQTSFIPIAITMCVFYIYCIAENPDFIQIQKEEEQYQKVKLINESKSYLVDSIKNKLDENIKTIKKLDKKLLKEDTTNEEKKKIISEIEIPTKEIINLLDTRVSISKLIAEENIDVEKYRVRTFVDKIVSLAENKLKNKDVEFVYDIDPNIPFVLSGDVSKLEAVINSIIENAIYYTTYGKILLSMSYNKINDKLIELMVSVTDTGRGMTKNEIDDINISLNSITFLKKIAENLQGTLIYESTIGAGSTFYLKVPQNVEDNTPMGGYTKFIDYTKKNIEYKDFSNKRILIVDDNSISIKVLVKQLKKYNIEPDTCNNSVGCIQRVKTGQEYDLIFMDDYMEGTTGKDTLELISKISKISGYKLAPVVVFTANAIAGARQQYIARGFDDFLEKPVDIIELDKILKGKFEK